MVTFPAKEITPLAGTKLYCLMTKRGTQVNNVRTKNVLICCLASFLISSALLRHMLHDSEWLTVVMVVADVLLWQLCSIICQCSGFTQNCIILYDVRWRLSSAADSSWRLCNYTIIQVVGWAYCRCWQFWIFIILLFCLCQMIDVFEESYSCFN